MRLAVSPEISTAMAAGLIDPTILIPQRFLEQLADDEVQQICVHEAAHLLRFDDYHLMFQRVLEAVFALHPCVRWIARQMDLEREIACDDFVVEAGGEAKPYAACLARVVELSGGVRGLPAVAHVAEGSSNLAKRIDMLLDKTRNKRPRLLKARLAGLLVPLTLLAVTEKQLNKVVAATQRARRPLRGKDAIAMAAGKALGRYKMGKHFHLQIDEDRFWFRRNQDSIDQETALDGIYVVRTNVPANQLSSDKVVQAYKGLSNVEQAFRSLKSVDLKIRPVHHRLADRVRSHVLLCMLAWYVEWHLRDRLAPLLFDDSQPLAGEVLRPSVVAPAQRSPQAQDKARRKRTDDGLPVHSFHTLMQDLHTIAWNTVRMGHATLRIITTPTPFQQRVFDLLAVPLQP